MVEPIGDERLAVITAHCESRCEDASAAESWDGMAPDYAVELLDGLDCLRAELAAATARAETAEAEVDTYRAQLVQWAEMKQAVHDVREMRERAARTEQAEAEVGRLKDVALKAISDEKQLLRERIAGELNRAAELGYPANAAWVQDMHQAAYIARDGLNAWLAENGRNPDGTRQDGRRQPWEPIRNEQDIDDLAAKPEDRLSDAEFESFQTALREARGIGDA